MFNGKNRKGKSKMVIERPSFAEESSLGEQVIRKMPRLTTSMCSADGNRDYQQDSMYVTPSKISALNRKTRVLAIVCDGMGGMANGEKASQKVVQMIVQEFQRVQTDPTFNIPLFFKRGILAADRVISKFPKENRKGSGTTMAACIVEDDNLYWASVGDSRIYIIRGNQMQQVTRDHNYWMYLHKKIAKGEMTMEEAMANQKKEALISYLGIGNVSLIDINMNPFKLQYDDFVMLCSDGITKTLSESQIKEIITTYIFTPEKKAEALVEIAINANSHSQDNTSVILIHYEEIKLKKVNRR